MEYGGETERNAKLALSFGVKLTWTGVMVRLVFND